jgi:hypothetical protein
MNMETAFTLNDKIEQNL